MTGRILRIAVFVLLFSTVISCKTLRSSGMNPGDSAPDFTLSTLSGQSLSISDLKGKLILINFWASWCVPCLEEMPSLQRLYARYQSKGFVILGVGVNDDPGALRKFQQEFGISFPLVHDSNGQVSHRYRITGFPESFFVSQEGKLLLINDPETARPGVRIVGPRSWDSPTFQRVVEGLLNSG